MPTAVNSAATIRAKRRASPMDQRSRLISRAPQYWLMKMALPEQVPKQNRLNTKVKRLAWVTAE